jgi:hypothetical protein
MKIKFTSLLALALLLNFGAFAQFFDSVPYIGALGVYGGTRGTVNGFKGYDPDPSNTDADWTKGWTEFNNNAVAYPGDPGYNSTNSKFYTIGGSAQKVTISSDISTDMTLTSDKWYELSGLIHVLSGATLTIQPGTCIRGSLSNLGGLIITRGAKIMAVSDRNHPVVFTSGKATGSRVRGDWAGLLIIGNASVNVPNGHRRYEALPSDPLADYGGNNDADNSGSIRYMRVEYAGYNYLPDQEINGITFAGVGYGSHFDYMQSAFANDDDFEWFGGTSNHKYLVGYAGTDDVFDMDEGYNGKLQFLLGVRSAGATETSPAGACNGLEHDNNTNLGTPSAVNPNITAPTPTTTPTISNMTLVGPEHPGATKSSLSTLWQQRTGEAFRLRTNDATGVFNSITWGWPTMVNLPNVGNLSPSTQTRAADDELCIRNTVIITSNGDTRFNSSNFPTGGWATGATPWTGLGQMRNWIINGPAVSVYNYTGPTMNDTTRSTILDLGTSSSDITHPDYTGASNGPLSGLDYTVCDFTLTAGSAFKNASSFRHPRVAYIATPSIALDNTTIPAFTQIVGTPTASRRIIIKSNALSGSVVIAAPSGFEVSSNNTTWSAGYTKGNTAADTAIYIRMNRTTGGSSNGFLTLTSSLSTPEFNAINISLNGIAVAPATPFINVSVNVLNFSNLVGAPSSKSFIVYGKNLASNVTLTGTSVFQLSSDNATFASTLTLNQTAGVIASTKVYVRYNPTAVGTDTATISVAATGADIAKISASGTSKPSIVVTPGVVLIGGAFQIQFPVFNTVAGTASIAMPITISGTQLTDTVKIAFPANFELSVDSAFTSPITSANVMMLNTSRAATLNQKIYIRYNAATATTNAGFLTVYTAGSPITYSGSSSSITGPATQLISLSGRSVASGSKYISLTAPSYQLTYSSVLNVATAPKTIYVAGYNLGTDSVIVTAPSNWEISLNGTTYTTVLYLPNTTGTVAPTMVYIRYNPTTPIALNQFVIVNLSSVGIPLPNTNTATNLVEMVFGIATPALNVNLGNLPTFYTTVGKPSYSNPIVLNGSSLSNNVIVTSTNNFEVSLDSVTYSTSITVNQTGGNVPNTKVYVRYNGGTTAGSISGNYVNFNSINAPAIPFFVSAVAVLPPLPILNLSTASLTAFNTSLKTPTAAQSFTMTAQNLVDTLRITVGSDYEISTDSINYKKAINVVGDANGNIATQKLFARFNRTTKGSSTDTIYFNSTAIATQKVVVSGTSTYGVGINEISNLLGYNVYPNPAQRELNIDFTLENSGNVKIQLIDISGRTIREMNQEFRSGNNSINLNIGDINNGFYFVKIENNNISKVSRLMISK